MDERSCFIANAQPELIMLGSPHCVVIYWLWVSREYIYSEYVKSGMANCILRWKHQRWISHTKNWGWLWAELVPHQPVMPVKFVIYSNLSLPAFFLPDQMLHSLCLVTLGHVQLFATPWTVSCQIPLYMEEYWSGLPCPPPGDLPNPGTEPRSSALQVDSLLSELWGKPKSYFFSYHLMSPVIRLCSLPISGILHVRGKEYQGRKRLCGQHCGYLQSLLFNILFNHPPVWRGWWRTRLKSFSVFWCTQSG